MHVNYLNIIFLLGTCASRTGDVTELRCGHPYRKHQHTFHIGLISVLPVFLLKLCMYFSRPSCVLLLWCTVSVQLHATKAYRGSKSVAPLIFTLGTRWLWVVNYTLRPIYTRGRTRGWVGPRAGLGVFDKWKTACPCQEPNPEPSTRSLDSMTTPPRIPHLVKSRILQFLFSTHVTWVTWNNNGSMDHYAISCSSTG
jgi:hypothetical protein